MFTSVLLVVPLSPTSSQLILKLFGDPGSKRDLSARLCFLIASRLAAREVRRVIEEDLLVLPSIQTGLQSPQLPDGGLISMREERIFHFQNWIKSHLTAPHPSAALHPIEL
jgi:choline monooxygenase